MGSCSDVMLLNRVNLPQRSTSGKGSSNHYLSPSATRGSPLTAVRASTESWCRNSAIAVARGSS